MKKLVIITALVFAVTGIVTSISSVSAQTPTPTTGKTIVQRIAERFGLNQSDVEAVFDQQRQEHQAEHRVRMEERLNQLVAEGTLNETQKQAILTKLQEMASQKQSMKDSLQTMTPEQRQAEMQKKQQEMKAWADSLGIDQSLLRRFGHPGFGHKMGRMMK